MISGKENESATGGILRWYGISVFLPGAVLLVVVVVLAFRYAARSVPRGLLYDAWPAETRLLERLIGSR